MFNKLKKEKIFFFQPLKFVRNMYVNINLGKNFLIKKVENYFRTLIINVGCQCKPMEYCRKIEFRTL